MSAEGMTATILYTGVLAAIKADGLLGDTHLKAWARDTAKDVLSLSTPVRIPAGWVISRTPGGELFVSSPISGPGMMHPRLDKGRLSERLLHCLAAKLLEGATP